MRLEDKVKKKILSFDMDMTLLDDKTNEIPKSALEAIDKVRDDCYIVIATGRDLSQPMNKPLLDLLRPDGLVHINGMKVTVEGEDILDKRFGSQLSKDVIEFANAKNMCLLTLVDSVQYYSNLEGLKKFEDTKLNYDDILGRKLIPMEKVNVDRIYSMGLVGSDEEANLLQEAFPQIKVTEVFHSLWYDVIAKGVSKAVGMEYLLKHFNKTWEDVIAFGDSMNDYEIMSHAGFSVAMGNSSEKLKKIADFVTKDIDDDGIAYAMRNIMI
jgi:hypothetical protein